MNFGVPNQGNLGGGKTHEKCSGQKKNPSNVSHMINQSIENSEVERWNHIYKTQGDEMVF